MSTAGLYIHVPFCEAKCCYCAFYSVADPTYRHAYVDAVLREAAQRLEEADTPWREAVFDTLYLGGGTPSVLSIADCVRLFEGLNRLSRWSASPEITFELNPEHRGLLSDLKRHTPVNRLSMGIQSFRDDRLRFMRRRHNGSEARAAIETAAAVGFDNLSIDLIYGLPDMTASEWTAQLDTAAAYRPPHLSAYALTMEPGSLLARQVERGDCRLPDQDVLASQYGLLTDWAERQGYAAYEVSNFAWPGHEARHNSRYWDVQTPYLGLGPGAHSFCRLPSAAAGHDAASAVAVRRANRPDVRTYVSEAYGPGHFEQERLSETDLYHEYVMTALRTEAGLNKGRLAALPAPLRQACLQNLQPLLAEGLLIECETAYRPTPAARYRADGLALSFF
ncbi:MAG: radical SAM family heme chaperone HemW [Bacteroidales bacterium]|nr:radical SAM family heme chaperone HemW [Bacteroidales bacterium]